MYEKLIQAIINEKVYEMYDNFWYSKTDSYNSASCKLENNDNELTKTFQ